MIGKMVVRFTMFVFLNVYLIHPDLCGSEKVHVLVNTKIADAFLIRTVLKGTFASCVDTCVFITDCLSVSYNRITTTCRMFNSSSTTSAPSDIVQEKDTVLIDAANWPRSRTGECWQKPCPVGMKCTPTLDSFTCQIEGDVGCRPYIPPEHGSVMNKYGYPVNTTEQLYPVGYRLLLSCVGNYVTSIADPSILWVIVCRDSLEWSWGTDDYACYTVAEVCKHEVLERFYPSRAQITVTSSIPGWNTSDALLDSGGGWIAETHDAQQYIQFQFDKPYWIGGLKTKGGLTSNGDSHWVTAYKVLHSKDCTTYDFVTVDDAVQTFQANTDATGSVTNHFERQKEAKCLRVHPTSYSGGILMKLGLLACDSYDESP